MYSVIVTVIFRYKEKLHLHNAKSSIVFYSYFITTQEVDTLTVGMEKSKSM